MFIYFNMLFLTHIPYAWTRSQGTHAKTPIPRKPSKTGLIKVW